MREIAILGDSLVSGNIFGIQRFAYEILREVDDLNPDISITIVVPEHADINILFKNIKIEKYGNIKNAFLWRQICFPRYLQKYRKIGVDLTLGLPFFKCDIVCLHDCTYEKFDENFKTFREKLKRQSYLIRTKRLVKKSKLIITVSNYSKKDICNYYKISENKVKVIYNAWQHYHRITADENVFAKIGLKSSEQYFFSLGSALRHKNLLWILKAALQNPSYIFVITGSNQFSNYLQDIEIDKVKNVIYTGYLSDGEVKALMSKCRAFIHPSFCEGFGIPPLEALASGANIIISNATCLPEIYGDSAIYLNPSDYKIDMKEFQNFPDKKLKLETLAKYSWKRSATKFIEILEQL